MTVMVAEEAAAGTEATVTGSRAAGSRAGTERRLSQARDRNARVGSTEANRYATRRTSTAAGTQATVTGTRAAGSRAGGSARGTGPGRRTGGRTQQGTSRGRRTSTAAPRKPAPTAAPKPPPTPAERRKAQRAKATAAVKKHAPTDKAHRTGYQPVILAEFVAAIVLTAATPFADNSRKGISPYAGKDVMQLSAITLTYLILALVSLGGRGPGRVAAWVGGLVLLTVGLSEAANIAKVLDVFGTGKASTQDLASGGAAGAVGGAEGFSESA